MFVNDRLLAPNRQETREAVRPDMENFCRKLFRGGEVSFSYRDDPRSLFAVSVKALQRYSVAELLANLA